LRQFCRPSAAVAVLVSAMLFSALENRMIVICVAQDPRGARAIEFQQTE
jgi:hypothetical protein